jgi:hypothetical protein
MDIARLTLSADVRSGCLRMCDAAQSKEQQNWDLLSQIARVDQNATRSVGLSVHWDQEDSRVVDKRIGAETSGSSPWIIVTHGTTG